MVTFRFTIRGSQVEVVITPQTLFFLVLLGVQLYRLWTGNSVGSSFL